MNEKEEAAIKQYQCSGCVSGSFPHCYKKSINGISCDDHVPGTFSPEIGTIFLGMPIGFNRIGPQKEIKINIYKTFKDLEQDWDYSKFNVPVWKYLNEAGHTIIRGISPRINAAFLHVVLENCIKAINCQEITGKDIAEMD